MRNITIALIFGVVMAAVIFVVFAALNISKREDERDE